MTTCLVCARRDGPAGHAAADAPGSAARSTALLLRVWDDGGEPRARLMGVDVPYRTVATAHGVDAICDAVRAWLTRR